MVTVLTEGETIEVPAGRVEGDRLWLSEAELEHATGWSARREGLCRGDVCVPIPPGRQRDFLRDGQVDAAAAWRHLGKPVVHSEDASVWVLGEAARRAVGASARRRCGRSRHPTSPCLIARAVCTPSPASAARR
jgi:hypothetical protein